MEDKFSCGNDLNLDIIKSGVHGVINPNHVADSELVEKLIFVYMLLISNVYINI